MTQFFRPSGERSGRSWGANGTAERMRRLAGNPEPIMPAAVALKNAIERQKQRIAEAAGIFKTLLHEQSKKSGKIHAVYGKHMHGACNADERIARLGGFLQELRAIEDALFRSHSEGGKTQKLDSWGEDDRAEFSVAQRAITIAGAYETIVRLYLALENEGEAKEYMRALNAALEEKTKKGNPTARAKLLRGYRHFFEGTI